MSRKDSSPRSTWARYSSAVWRWLKSWWFAWEKPTTNARSRRRTIVLDLECLERREEPLDLWHMAVGPLPGLGGSIMGIPLIGNMEALLNPAHAPYVVSTTAAEPAWQAGLVSTLNLTPWIGPSRLSGEADTQARSPQTFPPDQGDGATTLPQPLSGLPPADLFLANATQGDPLRDHAFAGLDGHDPDADAKEHNPKADANSGGGGGGGGGGSGSPPQLGQGQTAPAAGLSTPAGFGPAAASSSPFFYQPSLGSPTGTLPTLAHAHAPHQGPTTPHTAATVAAATDQNTASTAPNTTPAALPTPVANAVAQSPLRFVPNVGQTDASVNYQASGPGYQLFLTPTEADFTLSSGLGSTSLAGSPDVLRLQLLGANSNAQPVGQGLLSTRSNFFTGSNAAGWYTDVANYSAVAYANVYPGIDLVFQQATGQANQLEYTWVVHPGADPSQIRMNFAGAQSVQVDQQGNLVVQTPHGQLVETGLQLSQSQGAGQQAVSGGYTLLGGTEVGFSPGTYNTSQTLAIDPVISYSTYLGGSGTDTGYGVAVDAAGNAYVTGVTASTNFPTLGGVQGSNAGGNDVFVAKYDSSGNMVYSTYIGGSSNDQGNGIGVDAAGAVYVVGTTGSSDFPTQNPIQALLGGGTDAFVFKLSAAGNVLEYSTYVGGSGNETGTAIAVGADGSAYLTGQTVSSNFPTNNAYQSSRSNASGDAFAVKVDPAGTTFLYATYLAGNATNGADSGNGIAVDSTGAAYVAGSTGSTNFPTTVGAYQTSSGGGVDAFLTKFTPAGNALSYATLLGGSSSDVAYGVAVDPSGDATVAGSTQSTNFPTLHSFGGPAGGVMVGFVSRINASGSGLVYSSYYGNGGQSVNAVAVDPAGDAFLTGSGGGNVVQFNAFSSAGSAFVAAVPAAGSGLTYSSRFGGGGSDVGRGIAVSLAGDAWVTGSTTSTNFPTVGAAQGSNGGGTDAFLTRVNLHPLPPTITAISSDTGYSSSDQITSSSSFSLSGTGGVSGAYVTVYRAGQTAAVGSIPVGGGGTWSGIGDGGLSNGVYAYTATQTVSGYTSAPSSPFLVTVDSTAPTVTLTVASSPNSENPVVTVTATDNVGLPASATVTLDVDLNNNGNFTDPGETGYQTATMTNGVATFAVSPALTVGNTVRLRARVSDLAGNQGTSNVSSLTVGSVGSPWTLTDATVSTDPLSGNGVALLGDLNVSQALDLDQSPGTSVGNNPSLSYSSGRVDVRPIVAVELQTDNSVALPSTISAQLTWNGGTPQTAQSYNTTGIHPGDQVFIAQQVNAAVSTTGAYSWSLQVTMNYGTPIVVTQTGYTFVVAEDSSAFGAGWTFGSTDRLISIASSGSIPAGLLREYGTGGWSFYALSGGSYTSPQGDNGTLSAVTGGYQYVTPDGRTWNFNSSGYESSFVSGDGQQTTTFSYSGSSLTGVATADGALTTISYSSGLASTIQTGSRTVTFGYSGSNLNTIQNADGGTRTFTYSGARLTGDSLASQSTTYAYASYVLSSMTQGIGSDAGTTTISPVVVQGLNALVAKPRNAASPLAQITNPLGFSEFQELDGKGRLLKDWAPDGGLWQTVRNGSGWVTSTTDPLGRTTTFTLDSAGYTTQITYPDGSTAQFQYNGSNHHALTQTTDQNGNITTYTLDSQGHPLTMVNALNQTTSYTWSSGLLQTTTDSLGNTTSLAYDADRRLTQTTFPDGGLVTLTYDSNGNVATQVNQLGYTTTFLNDALGRVTQTTDPTGAISTVQYDAAGNPTQTIDPLGRVTSLVYNTRGLLSSQTQAVGTALQRNLLYTYNGAGQQTARRDASGNWTFSNYDPAGRLVSQVDSYGNTQQYTYDQAGQQTSSRTALGQVTQQVYNNRGWVTKTIDNQGHVATTLYDSVGNATVQVDSLGHTSTTLYDALNRATTVIDSNSNRTTSIYDAGGNRTRSIDARGQTSTFAYDSMHRQTSSIDPLGNHVTSLYDKAGNVTQTTDQLGHATTYLYDKDNRQTVVIDASGGRTTTVYDLAGNVIRTINPLGQTTTLVVDSLNRTVSSTNPLAQTTTSLYDARDLSVGSEDAKGNVNQQTYDNDGRAIPTLNAQGQVTSQTGYDANGNVQYTIDANGNRTTFVYDSLNRLISTTDALSHTVTNVYDSNGNVTAAIDANGNTTTFAYDSLGRQISVQTPSGGITTTVYDNNGNVVNTIDPLGHTVTFLYDSAGRQTVAIDALGNVTTTVYDNAGNMINKVDPAANVTTFQYDSLNRETQMTDPLGHSVTMAYDSQGELTSQTDRLGRRIAYSYNSAGQLTGQTWYDASNTVVNVLTFTYDSAGNQLTAANYAGTYTMAYDQNNRLTQVQGLFGVTLTMSYDANNNRTLVQDSFGGFTTSVYNGVNLLATREFGGSGLTALRADMAYTNTNELGTISRYSNVAGTTLVGTASYTYDSQGRMTAIAQKNSSGTALATYAYGFDLADRVTTQTTSSGTVTYTYDVTNQLTSDTNKAYSYDANGNRTMTGYTTGTGNQLTNDGVFTYTYDAEGNLATKSKGTGLEKWYYTYDNLNHLASVRKTSDGTTNVMTATYTYDALGDRVQEDEWTSGGGNTTTKQVYLGSQVYADLTSGNAMAMRYIWGDNPNQALARVDSGGTLNWYGTNNEGSVVLVLDATGIRDQLTYDGYGNTLSETTPSLGGYVGYAGMYLDRNTGVYNTPGRDYDPLTGRWLQIDPSGFSAGDANLYRYAGNNATNAVDPSGLVESYEKVRNDLRMEQTLYVFRLWETILLGTEWQYGVSPPPASIASAYYPTQAYDTTTKKVAIVTDDSCEVDEWPDYFGWIDPTCQHSTYAPTGSPVGGWKALRTVLKQYPDGSLDVLLFSGHNGGCACRTSNVNEWIGGWTMPADIYQLIQKKLKKGGSVIIGSCHSGDNAQFVYNTVQKFGVKLTVTPGWTRGYHDQYKGGSSSKPYYTVNPDMTLEQIKALRDGAANSPGE